MQMQGAIRACTGKDVQELLHVYESSKCVSACAQAWAMCYALLH